MRTILPVVVITLLSPSVLAQERPEDVCPLSLVPLSMEDHSPIVISKSRFYSSKNSWGYLTIENVSRRVIRDLLLVVDYYNQDREKMTGITFRAATDGAKARTGSIRTEYVEDLVESLSGNQSTEIAGVSRTAVPACPAFGKVTFMSVTFADSESSMWEASRVSIGPVLKDAPALLVDKDDSLGKSNVRRFYVSLQVSQDGSVTKAISFKNSGGPIPAVLEEYLKALSFFPGIGAGKPADSSPRFLVRIHREGDNWAMVHRNEVATPVAFIDVVPVEARNGEYRIWYGDRPASRAGVRAP